MSQHLKSALQLNGQKHRSHIFHFISIIRWIYYNMDLETVHKLNAECYYSRIIAVSDVNLVLKTQAPSLSM